MVDEFSGLQSALADRYRIEFTDGEPRTLGQGGMATVFLARDLRHDRLVALKVIRPGLATILGPERFHREIAIVAHLNHPHILPLHDSGEAAGLLYYVMPWIAGGTLRDRLAREGPLPVDEALRIARDIGLALTHAHGHHIIHRDIKPSNILLAEDAALLADFGIALTSDDPFASEGITTAGMAIGTPAYMSPEQAAGCPVDGRSDLFSLACVLHEMLEGDEPFSRPPRNGGAATPAWLRVVVTKALAPDPGQRFQTATEFTAALRPPGRSAARPRRLATRVALGVAIVAAAVAVGATLLAGRNRIDPDLHVVLPFTEVTGTGMPAVSGAGSAALAYESLRRWRDAKRVDPARVREALANSITRPPMALSAALMVARRLGAGRLLWGETYRHGDITRVRGGFYDVEKGLLLTESIIQLGPELPNDIARLFTAMTDTLMGRGHAPPTTEGSRPLAAIREYLAADSLLLDWRLEEALQHYTLAIKADSGFALGYLQAARIASWLQAPSSDWKDLAARAEQKSGSLTATEAHHARALRFLGSGQMPAACGEYRILLAADSLDFAAWMGLGDCHAKDDAVIPDRKSRSGRAFRSSHWTAANAYLRALVMLPSSYRAAPSLTFDRLRRVLFTETGRYRVGKDSTGTSEFAAWPEAIGDSVTFVPFPRMELNEATHQPATFWQAIERERGILTALAQVWVDRYPTSPSAWRARAAALEQVAAVPAALEAVRRANRMTPISAEREELGETEARLRLRAGDFAGARVVTERLLANWESGPDSVVSRLTPLAGLVGQAATMRRMAERIAPATSFLGADGRVFSAPESISKDAMRLIATASLGLGRDSVGPAEARILAWVGAVAEGDRSSLRYALLGEAEQIGFPAWGRGVTHRDPAALTLPGLQTAVVTGDVAGFRRSMNRVGGLRAAAGVTSADLSVDAIYHEAFLWAAIGDTAAAVGMLDRMLGDLPHQSGSFIHFLQGPASLVHAMALRARIALRQGDRPTADRWALGVRDLWKNADPEVKALVKDVVRW